MKYFIFGIVLIAFFSCQKSGSLNPSLAYVLFQRNASPLSFNFFYYF